MNRRRFLIAIMMALFIATISDATVSRLRATGTALPNTCSAGDLFILVGPGSDAQPGSNFYVCTEPNMWTVQGQPFGNAASATEFLADPADCDVNQGQYMTGQTKNGTAICSQLPSELSKFMERRTSRCAPNTTTGTNLTCSGSNSAGVIGTSAISACDATSPFGLQCIYTTKSATPASGDDSGTGAVLQTTPQWKPRMSAIIATSSDITSQRIWTVLGQDPQGCSGSSTACANGYMGLLYDSAVSANWMCGSSVGSGAAGTTSYVQFSPVVPVVASTIYKIDIDYTSGSELTCTIQDLTAGTAAVSVTKSDDLPTSTLDIGPYLEVTTLAAAQRSFSIFKYGIEQQSGAATVAAASPLAFPGAEGYGARTTRGAFGDPSQTPTVVKVTSLADSGAGTFRAAVEGTVAPRIVVFETSGTITLDTEVLISSPYITIAGETAPNPGITLRKSELKIKSHDVIVRHMRVRIGDINCNGATQAVGGAGGGYSGCDGMTAGGASTQAGAAGVYNVIYDHCSISWGLDENFDNWYDNNHDITIQHSIISEGLDSPLRTDSYPHGFGMLIGPNSRNFVLVNNIFAHNHDRNPLITNGASVYMTNNVVYNWTGGRAIGVGNTTATYSPIYPTIVDIINNVFIDGANTPTSSYFVSDTTTLPTDANIYHSGNLLVGLGTSTPRCTRPSANNCTTATVNPFQSTTPNMTTPDGFVVRSTTGLQAWVTDRAGARPLNRDSVDTRITGDVTNTTGECCPASQADVGGWPTLAVNTATITVAADAMGDRDGDGYKNFEEDVLFPAAAALVP